MIPIGRVDLAENWRVVRLGDIVDIAYGKALRSENRTGSGGVVVYASSGIVGEHDAAIHPGPSIVIGRKGAVGSVYYADGPFWCIDTAFYLKNVQSIIDLEFLSYRLISLNLDRLSITAAVPGISKKDLESVQFFLPPLSEQRRIAAILREADGLRRLRRHADERGRDLLPALFQEMFGNPEQNPMSWEKGKLGDVILSAKDGPHVSPQYSEDGIPFLSTRNIRAGQIVWDDLKYISPKEAEKLWKKCKPARGDILYTKGGTTGLAKVVDFDREIAIWVHIAALKPDLRKVNPLWLENMLNSRYCYEQSQKLTHGIANRDLGLTRMVQIEMYIPPLDLQQKFATQASNVQEVLSEQAVAAQSTEQLLQSSLARAFNGELTAVWRERHAELLHDEAVQRDIALGLRAAEPTLGDLEDDRVTRAEHEEAERQLRQANELLLQSSSPFLRSLADDIFGNPKQTLIDAALAVATQSIDWDAFQVGVPEEFRVQIAQVADSFRAIQQQARAQPALRQSPALAAHMMSALGQAVQLYQRAQVAAGNRAVREAFDNRLNTLIDAIAQAPAYFRAEDLAHNGVGIGAADETLRLLAALGYVRPVLVRGQARYRRVDPIGERVVVEELNG